MKSAYKLSLSVVTMCTLIYGCSKKVETSGHLPSLTTAPRQNQLVLTPGGQMPAANVHYIPQGYAMTVKGGHVVRVNTTTGETAEDFGVYHPKTAARFQTATTSAGANAPLSPLSHYNDIGNRDFRAWTYWNDSTGLANPINFFSTTWTVPALPAAYGQTIFIFEAMANLSASIVIQPVLQYGRTAAGGSANGWSISNWVTVGDSLWGYSDVIPVTPGTSLQGIVKLTGEEGFDTYNYSCSFAGYNNVLNYAPGDSVGKHLLTSGLLGGGQSAYEVLSGYSVINGQVIPILYPSDYPASQKDVVMNKITLSEISGYPTIPGSSVKGLNWTPAYNIYMPSEEHAVVVNSGDQGQGQVELYFYN